MSEFYVIRTIRGRRYLYKERRQRGQKPVSICLGRVDGGGGRSVGVQIAIALVGVEDEFGFKHDSLLNRMRDRAAQREAQRQRTAERGPEAEPQPEQSRAPDVAEGSEEGAGAGNGEEASE